MNGRLFSLCLLLIAALALGACGAEREPATTVKVVETPKVKDLQQQPELLTQVEDQTREEYEEKLAETEEGESFSYELESFICNGTSATGFECTTRVLVTVRSGGECQENYMKTILTGRVADWDGLITTWSTSDGEEQGYPETCGELT